MKCTRCDSQAILGEALCPLHNIIAEREYEEGRRAVEDYRRKKR